MVGNLSERVVELILDAGLFVVGEPPVPDMAHHADHLKRRRAKGTAPKLLADKVGSSKGMACQVLVNHHNRGAAQAILVGKETAMEELNAHHTQIVGRDG